MVGTQHRSLAVDIFEKQLLLLKILVGGQHLELARHVIFGQRGVGFKMQRQQSEILRLGGGDKLCRFDGMFLCIGSAANAGDECHRNLDAGCLQLLAGLYRLGRGDPLVDVDQHLVAARFGADINHLKSVAAQFAKLLVTFHQHILCRAIGGNSAALGENLVNFVENGDDVGRLDDESIAVCQKYSVKVIVVVFFYVMQVLNDLVELTHPELLALIHAAKGAGVAGAADGQLDYKTVRFAWRTVNIAFVYHKDFS